MLKTSLICLIALSLGCSTSTRNNDPQYQKARKIHEKCLTVDTHSDTPSALLEPGFDISRRNDPPQSRVDFPRMKEGGLDAMFFAVFTGQKARTPENYNESYRQANVMLDSIHSMVKKHSDISELALTADDGLRIEKTGKRAIYIGLENGFPLAKDINRVKEFYDRGVRYITLCHSFHNDICDSSSDAKEPENNGLSEYGKQVVSEMNRLGMLIDMSHASDKSFFDVVACSKAPVIASHSSVRAIAHNDRNMSDEMLKALAKNGGVIQICLLADYVSDPDTTTARYKEEKELRYIYRTKSETMNEAERAELNKRWREMHVKYPGNQVTVKDFVDHIDHVKKLVGIDYVGIGSDFDGGGGLDDCTDVSQFPNITLEMLKRGYTEEEIRKVWGGNFFRVFKEAERLAEK